MSVNLTTALQNVGGRDPNYADSGPVGGPVGASRQTGLVLLDSDTVAFTAGPVGIYDTISATATVSGLPVATEAGQVPTSTGAGTTYIAQTPAVGLTLIASQTLADAADTVTFSAIPQTFSNLKLVITSTINAGTTYFVNLNFNGSDSGYSYNYTQNYEASFTAYTNASATGSLIGVLLAGGDQAFTGLVDIPGYAGSAASKVTLFNTVTGTSFVANGNSNWASTSAITSIVISNSGSSINWDAGSVFELYGY